jgi:SYP7 family syntaxin
MPDAIGRDIDAGLEVLYRIQEIVGTGVDELDQDQKIHNAFGGDPFMELKYKMMKKIEVASESVKQFNQMDASASAPEIKIRKDQELRETFKVLTNEWKELDRIYQKEASKHKSKLGEQELLNRCEIKDNLKDHIDGLKEEFLSQYSGGSSGGGSKLPTFDAFKADMAKKANASGGAGPKSVVIEQEEMTSTHKARLQELEMRDLRENEIIDQIDQGVDRLGVMANAMGEEVETQAVMLSNLESDIQKVQEHVESVNDKLKETLKEVRASDRFCMDVFCVLLLLGMCGVFLKIHNGNQSDDDK